MLSAFVLLLGASQVLAFPGMGNVVRDYPIPGCSVSKLCNTPLAVSNAQAKIPAKPNAATMASAARSNCGIFGVCNTFNAQQQYVSTSGANAFIAPSSTDRRGPCPGLNAAANHGYLPRTGLATLTTTTEGLFNAYGFEPDFAAFLAVFSAALGGDIATITWSIGGPLPANVISTNVGPEVGISWSHNTYEGDTSITRCDAYTNGGDAHASSYTRFAEAYASGMDNDRYTLDKFARLYAKNTVRSIMQNPYYFAPLVSTTVVSPAAYNFVINFMSNHSAAEPGGYLNGAIFKSFFSYTGEYPNFTWNPGMERIPDNWYRRPNENPYGAQGLVADLIPDFVAYPDTFRLGGNTNGTNTYTGVDIANLTGGTYNAATLFQGDNFACFFFQGFQELVPSYIQDGVNDVATAVALIDKYVPSFFTSLNCPQLSKFDTSLFTPYTGNGYMPKPPKKLGPQNC